MFAFHNRKISSCVTEKSTFLADITDSCQSCVIGKDESMEKHDPISTSDHQVSRHDSEAAAEAPAPTRTATEANWWTPYQHSLTGLVPDSWELARIHPDTLQLHQVLQYFWNKCDPLP